MNERHVAPRRRWHELDDARCRRTERSSTNAGDEERDDLALGERARRAGRSRRAARAEQEQAEVAGEHRPVSSGPRCHGHLNISERVEQRRQRRARAPGPSAPRNLPRITSLSFTGQRDQHLERAAALLLGEQAHGDDGHDQEREAARQRTRTARSATRGRPARSRRSSMKKINPSTKKLRQMTT